MELFNTPVQSTIIILLTVVYFIIASITTFDIRINQAITQGEDEIPLPLWVAIFYWLLWAIWIWILLLNWQYALVIFAIKFILKVLPVLEIIGNILMSPFKHKYKNKRYAKEYYSELYKIYDFTMSLFENDSDFKNLLDKENALGYELLAIMFFYSSQKNKEVILDDKLSLKLIDLIHDFYYKDLQKKFQLGFKERQQASNLLNKRYSDYSNLLNTNEPILALTRYFINNSFMRTDKDLSIILSASKYLVESIKQIETMTNNLKLKYSF